jgi:hypothetical protein
MWKNIVQPDRQTDRQATDDNIIRHMRIACWKNKARIQNQKTPFDTDIALQVTLRERVSALRYDQKIFLHISFLYLTL